MIYRNWHWPQPPESIIHLYYTPLIRPTAVVLTGYYAGSLQPVISSFACFLACSSRWKGNRLICETTQFLFVSEVESCNLPFAIFLFCMPFWEAFQPPKCALSHTLHVMVISLHYLWPGVPYFHFRATKHRGAFANKWPPSLLFSDQLLEAFSSLSDPIACNCVLMNREISRNYKVVWPTAPDVGNALWEGTSCLSLKTHC